MDISIAGILMLDGITNGAIYGLLGLVTVLVFTVTRIIFIPQGEFVAYGALTLAFLQAGKVPGTLWMLLILALTSALMRVFSVLKDPAIEKKFMTATRSAFKTLFFPLVISSLTYVLAPMKTDLWVQALMSVAIVSAFGPLVYHVAFESLEDATPLVLLIVSVAVHFAMTGFGLLFFGAEGYRNPNFWSYSLELLGLRVSGQALIIFGTALVLIGLLWLFFEKTLYGKALRATAINRNGARLMGVSTQTSGQLTFTLATFLCAVSGLLIGPTTTVFYDSGFLIGLKGFVAAVMAGLVSYPLAMVGALFVGIVESFGSFWASAFKEVIVFTLILIVLLLRTLRSGSVSEEH
jgi:branched-chain amino acid transport system permease protein